MLILVFVNNAHSGSSNTLCEASINKFAQYGQAKTTFHVKDASMRDIFLTFFGSMPSELKLPLTTRGYINLLNDTGESRPGISAVWSSSSVLSQVFSLSGPLGPTGSLSMSFGAIGDSALNPLFWWSRAIQKKMWDFAPLNSLENAGPLSEFGPLGSLGPLSDDWLQGNYNFLGTTGPLGALGPLGPLGPMGAVMSKGGVTLKKAGMYQADDTKNLVTSVVVDFNKSARTYGVMERFDPQAADKLSAKWGLDGSFMVDSHIGLEEKNKAFRLTSRHDGIISVLVVPDQNYIYRTNAFGFPYVGRANFGVVAQSSQGTRLAESNEAFYSNMLQLQVRKGEKIKLTVNKQGHPVSPFDLGQKFRLIVVNSSPYFLEDLWKNCLNQKLIEILKESENSDDMLFYFWSKLIDKSFRNYFGSFFNKNTADYINFWKDNLNQAVKEFEESVEPLIPQNVQDARDFLLKQTEENLKSYESFLRQRNPNGKEMLSMWKDLMSNTESTQEKMFDLTEEKAYRLPHQWLEWMRLRIVAKSGEEEEVAR